MKTLTGKSKVTIIGAGLGGSLMAIYMARRGFDVEVYERRGDMRSEPVARGRSINMTLAARGLRALEEVGLRDTVMQMTTPLRGRIVHTQDGRIIAQPYGKHAGEAIHAVMRNELNMVLMTEAERYENVKLHFHHRCLWLDKENATVQIHDEKNNERFNVEADLVIGADGAFSTIRQQMQRGERAAYQQDFLDWGYKELIIPACPDGSYRIDSRGLHIWPRGDSMLMAMPNSDGSFTCTFIYPFEGEKSFASLRRPKDIRAFFMSRFPDALPLVPTLEEDFLRNPIVEMITTRTSPWRFKEKVVLIGDSCHAVLPFYGQGMNAAFEDCRVLNECMDEYPDDWATAFAVYQARRKPSTDILAELSEKNFYELCHKVRSPLFIARKKVDILMNRLFPRHWFPLYTMISHMTIPIADAIKVSERQNRIAKLMGLDLLMMIVALFIFLADKFKVATQRRPAPEPEPENFQTLVGADLSAEAELASAAGMGAEGSVGGSAVHNPRSMSSAGVISEQRSQSI